MRQIFKPWLLFHLHASTLQLRGVMGNKQLSVLESYRNYWTQPLPTNPRCAWGRVRCPTSTSVEIYSHLTCVQPPWRKWKNKNTFDAGKYKQNTVWSCTIHLSSEVLWMGWNPTMNYKSKPTLTSCVKYNTVLISTQSFVRFWLQRRAPNLFFVI